MYLFPSFFKSPEWNEERTFSKAEAIIDIAYLCYSNKENTVVYFCRQKNGVEKNEIIIGRDLLSKRWNWHPSKVRRFLIELQERGLLEYTSTNHGTRIKLNEELNS
jgi:hypothetical protein